jgi:uncharacterized protein with NRDE domain
MNVWRDAPGLLAGRDLAALGTWLAVDRTRRLGVVTNYRDVQARRPDAPSRGGLIPRWLAQPAPPAQFLEDIEPQAAGFAGFNLLLNDADSLWYASNRAPRFARALDPGIYGLSNLLLDTPWPKLLRVRAGFERWLQQRPVTAAGEPDAMTLFELLADRRPGPPEPPDSAQPLPPEWAQILSAPFVVHPRYGTRCSTLVMIGHDGSLWMRERRFDAAGAICGESAWDLAPGEWPQVPAA